MTGRDFTYLTVPYSHEDPAVRDYRSVRASKAAAYLIRQGHVVFSPISHFHPIALAGELPGDWEFWECMDRVYLQHSRMVVVLTLDGWTDSKGIRAELEIAKGMDLPVLYMREPHITGQGTHGSFELQWVPPK